MIIHELDPQQPNRELVIDYSGDVDVFVPILGAINGEFSLRVVLRKEGAAARIYGAGVLNGEQKLKLTVDTIHQAPNTTGSTLVKAVLKDKSNFEFFGMIKILKAAQGSNDFLQQDSLLLSDEASANAVPGLEIEANEVKASHAATAAPVNQDQLFYLRSRGIPETMAVQLVAEAFLAPAMRGVDEQMHDKLLLPLQGGFRAAPINRHATQNAII
ncbi:MAG: SufD family Fe-S cluster assembly protein [Candidatus Kerfeldbacteria bacterium]|nr:SufD family Fe-S cluster assembly protein [Candidatus Kerfeldbacteria bacterium]